MNQQIRNEYLVQVQTAIDSMLNNLDGELDWSKLASRAFCSPFHFHHIFRGMTGETAVEMLRRCRLERAAHSLKHTDFGVAEIAIRAGFVSHEGFTRAFKSEFLMSPSEWRNSSETQFRLIHSNGIHFEPDGRRIAFIPIDQETKMNIEIKLIDPLRLGTLEHRGSYDKIGTKFGELWGIAQQHDLTAGAFVGVYYSAPDEFPEEELVSDAGVVIPLETPIPNELTEKVIPGGKYAVYRHIGPYSELGGAWNKFLGQGVLSEGIAPSDTACFELYINSAMVVGPENAITDLYVGVK